MKRLFIPLTIIVALLIMASPAVAQVDPVLAIDISKQAEGADSRTFPSGSDVTFQITLRNAGNVEIDQIIVSDEETDTCNATINSNLLPGDSFSYICTSMNVTDSFINVAEAEAYAVQPGPFGTDPVYDSDPSTVVIEDTPTGDEGCTPGYWKQDQHFDSWSGFAQNDLFYDKFGRVITVRGHGKSTIDDPTLLQALDANGGGINALARHGVAALLNASSPDVAFAYTPAEVIQMVQDAIDGVTDLEGTKDMLAKANEGGCPLN